MNEQNQQNQNTADNADAAASAAAEAGNTNTNTNTGKKKSKLRRFGGYALKGAVVAAVGAGIYYGARALLGNAGEVAVDAIDGAVGAVA